METNPPFRGEPILGKPFGDAQRGSDPIGRPINDPTRHPIGRPVKKPIKVHPVGVNPVKGTPITAHPVKVQPVPAKPIHPIVGKPVKGKPVLAHPIAGKPVEGRPETHPVSEHPVKGRPILRTPVEPKPVEAKPVQVQPSDPAGPVTPAVVVATIAGVIAGRAYNRGEKNPDITAQQVHSVLVLPSFAKRLSAESLAQAISLLGRSKSAFVIANAKAVALQVVRARLTVSKKLSAAASPTSTHAPVAHPIHTTPVHKPVVIHEPEHPVKGGHNLV